MGVKFCWLVVYQINMRKTKIVNRYTGKIKLQPAFHNIPLLKLKGKPRFRFNMESNNYYIIDGVAWWSCSKASKLQIAIMLVKVCSINGFITVIKLINHQVFVLSLTPFN